MKKPTLALGLRVGTSKPPFYYTTTMLPNFSNYNSSPDATRMLISRIGKSMRWISERTGISERRLRYLIAGTRTIDGQEKPVLIDYPEQYTLEQLADAAETFDKK